MLIRLFDEERHAFSRIVLRTLDVALAVLGLVFTSPVLLVCFIAIRITSAGPAIFRQERVGQHRRVFICYKMRTMRIGTRSLATHEVSRMAITPVGAFLRSTKLDELPQLLNVLRGEMSLVGPRPCLPTQSVLIAARERRGVHGVRPGITGPAQILGVDMSEPERLAELDEGWIRGRSIAAYFRIIALTVFGYGQGDKTRAT